MSFLCGGKSECFHECFSHKQVPVEWESCLAFGIRLPARGRDAFPALLNGSSSLRMDRVRCTDDCAKGIKSFKWSTSLWLGRKCFFLFFFFKPQSSCFFLSAIQPVGLAFIGKSDQTLFGYRVFGILNCHPLKIMMALLKLKR